MNYKVSNMFSDSDVSNNGGINKKEKKNNPFSNVYNYTINNDINDLISSLNKKNFEIVSYAGKLGANIIYDRDKKPKPLSDKITRLALSEYIIEIFKKYNKHIYQLDDKSPIYLFNGTFWQKMDIREFQHLIRDISLRLGIPPIKAKDKYFNEKLSEQVLYSFYSKEIKNNSNNFINLKNGTFDLETMRLKEFDYKDFLKYQLNYEYNPNEVNELWLKFLDDVIPNKDTQKTIQEVIGSIFIKSIKLEYAFFFYGSGSNGKSVVMEVLEGVIGSENILNYSLSDFSEPFNRANLQDKLLNISSENSKELQADIFKKLASGEKIQACYKYGDPFTLENYAKSIYLVNEMNFNNIEHSHGFFRRFLIIPFNVTISDDKKDKNLHNKILENKTGVLNWIIEGAKRVLENKDIFISKECETQRIEFMSDMDSVSAFMNDYKEYYINKYSSYKKVYLKEIYDLYIRFCNDNGFKYPVHNKTLSKRLLSLNFDDLIITKGKDNLGAYFEINTPIKKPIK